MARKKSSKGKGKAKAQPKDAPLKIQYRKVEDLANDPNNVRQHNERNIAAIVSSLRRFGQRKPIVVNPEGIVIAGNGLLEAARRLKWEKVAVVATDLVGAEATLFGIADNRTAELSNWDYDGLDETLKGLGSLPDIDPDEMLDSIGFTPTELDKLLGEEDHRDEKDPDSIPDYSESDETVDVKIIGIPFTERQVVRTVIENALQAKNIHFDEINVY